MNIAVVAAVIEEDDAFLLTRRQPGTHLEGLWEFPGGKIDAGESHEAALRRELREELGVDARVEERVFETTHAYPDRTITLYFYRCVLDDGPTPQLGQEMRWVTRAELTTFGVPPADTELIRLLVGSGDR